MRDEAVERLFADPDLDWQPVSPGLVTERRLGGLPLALPGLGLLALGIFVAGGWPVLCLGAVCLIAAAWYVLVVVPRAVHSWRYAERAQDLLVSHGRLMRHLVVVPYGRMQVIEVSANPISRKLGIATVTLVTASANTDARIPGLPVDDAQILRDRLAARGEAMTAGL